MRLLRLLLPVLLLAWGCTTPFQAAKGHAGAMVEVEAAAMPAFDDDAAYEGLAEALTQSHAWLDRQLAADPNRTTHYGDEVVPLARVRATVERLQALAEARLPAAELSATLAREFRVFRTTGGDAEGHVLFTGYYLPELRGSRLRSEQFPVPLFGVPEGIVTVRPREFPQLGELELSGFVVKGRLEPLPTRAAIATGALDGRAAPVLFVDSAIDAFFLEIQGSGVVRLDDGSTVVATYAGKNGHRYSAIGGELIRRGALTKESVSMQSIRAWLEAHPEARAEVMNTNPSYVFFRVAEAAMGSIGVPVTAGRTLATDTKVFPKGAPCFIDAERPAGDGSEALIPLRRLMVDQDTGGAIKTAGHVDVFWGAGPAAANTAGRMKHQGHLYWLLLR